MRQQSAAFCSKKIHKFLSTGEGVSHFIVGTPIAFGWTQHVSNGVRNGSNDSLEDHVGQNKKGKTKND